MDAVPAMNGIFGESRALRRGLMSLWCLVAVPVVVAATDGELLDMSLEELAGIEIDDAYDMPRIAGVGQALLTEVPGVGAPSTCGQQAPQQVTSCPGP